MRNTERPRICFINTPGEITRAVEGYDSPLKVSPSLRRNAAVDVVDLTEPEIDIAELSMRIADTIHPRLGDYDGFVVTAGQRFLQYIAPRLAFAFGPSLDKTVVVTGTNISATFQHSGASVDLIRATIVASHPFREVVVNFDNLITRGVDSELRQMGNTFRAYKPHSDQYGYLGQFTAAGVEVNHQRVFKSGEDTFHNQFDSRIVAISVNPGSDPRVYVGLVTSGVQGLIMESPAWNIPSQEPYSFIPLVSDFIRHNLPVMLTSRSLDTLLGEKEKTTGEKLMDGLNGITGRYMTPEVAAIKFSWVIARVSTEIATGILPEKEKLPKIKELMRKPYVGEYGIFRTFNA